jgi:squalene-hopene/tetraprenyl-beta-curcumene cyclase
LRSARVFTKIWLALFGVYPWSGVPSLPPELVYFPLWMPFNLYDFACWARGTVAPLTIVVSKRPVRELGVDVSEIIAPGSEKAMQRVTGSRHWLMAVERLQKLYERLPSQSVATMRSGASHNGLSSAKKPTGAGAEFSRRGSIR